MNEVAKICRKERGQTSIMFLSDQATEILRSHAPSSNFVINVHRTSTVLYVCIDHSNCSHCGERRLLYLRSRPPRRGFLLQTKDDCVSRYLSCGRPCFLIVRARAEGLVICGNSLEDHGAKLVATPQNASTHSRYHI